MVLVELIFPCELRKEAALNGAALYVLRTYAFETFPRMPKARPWEF